MKPGDKQENHQRCDLLYCLRLGEMRHYFSVLISNLVRYRLFDVRVIPSRLRRTKT